MQQRRHHVKSFTAGGLAETLQTNVRQTLPHLLCGFDDIYKLLAAFRALIDNGGSLLVIEHNMDVIKTADYVIDLGPEGGIHGGEIVAVGTPEVVANARDSFTGKYLAEALNAKART